MIEKICQKGVLRMYGVGVLRRYGEGVLRRYGEGVLRRYGVGVLKRYGEGALSHQARGTASTPLVTDPRSHSRIGTIDGQSDPRNTPSPFPPQFLLVARNEMGKMVVKKVGERGLEGG